MTMYLEEIDVELKPCPFCGESLELIGEKWKHGRDSKCIAKEIVFGRWEFYMHDAWNRRA